MRGSLLSGREYERERFLKEHDETTRADVELIWIRRWQAALAELGCKNDRLGSAMDKRFMTAKDHLWLHTVIPSYADTKMDTLLIRLAGMLNLR